MKRNIEKISNDAISQLVDIGQLIRQHRKSFKITANAAAQTAGISRVTLHRIEKGEPTVSMGAYLKCDQRSRSASAPLGKKRSRG